MQSLNLAVSPNLTCMEMDTWANKSYNDENKKST